MACDTLQDELQIPHSTKILITIERRTISSQRIDRNIVKFSLFLVLARNFFL